MNTLCIILTAVAVLSFVVFTPFIVAYLLITQGTGE